MKKLKLRALDFSARELLSREQMKQVLGGVASGGSGSGGSGGLCAELCLSVDEHYIVVSCPDVSSCDFTPNEVWCGATGQSAYCPS